MKILNVLTKIHDYFFRFGCPYCKSKIKLKEGICPYCKKTITTWDLDMMLSDKTHDPKGFKMKSLVE